MTDTPAEIVARLRYEYMTQDMARGTALRAADLIESLLAANAAMAEALETIKRHALKVSSSRLFSMADAALAAATPKEPTP